MDIKHIKKISCNRITVVDEKTIIGDNEDAILKVLHLSPKNTQEVFKGGFDLKAYNKDKNKSDVASWFNDRIEKILYQKYINVQDLLTHSVECKSKTITKEDNIFFYDVMSYKSEMGGEYIDLFNDGVVLFLYKSIFKLRKNEILDVERHRLISGLILYKFTLLRSGDTINTYILSQNM